MKYTLLFIAGLSLLHCRPDEANDSSFPCQENSVPVEWVCEERINYNFCFPSSYISIPYLWKKSSPYSSLSQGISNNQGLMMPFDTSTFIVSPFPGEIVIDQNNKLTERLEICDQGEIIGIFYYGQVQLDNIPDYFGYLYLRLKDSDAKYYLSATSEMDKEGVDDMIEAVKRIHKKI
jgi:hypothetical protein